MNHTKFYLWSLLIILTMGSCSTSTKKDTIKNPPKHVIMIGFDGMSSVSLRNHVNMPTYQKIMENGAYTLENRSILPSSSACNWASMYMGASSEIHGFNTWGSKKPDLKSRVLTENGLFPDLYYLLRKQKPESELGFIYEWGGMKYVVDTLSINKMEQVALSNENYNEALESSIKYIKEKKPTFCSIIFAEPDGAGHTYGWESKEYYNRLNKLDKALEKIVDSIKEAGIMDETIIILVSDHGGIGKSHGGITMNEMEKPIVFFGKGIKKGHIIKESTMTYDVASTIAYMLNIEQPQVWIGRPMKSIFE